MVGLDSLQRRRDSSHINRRRTKRDISVRLRRKLFLVHDAAIFALVGAIDGNEDKREDKLRGEEGQDPTICSS